MSASTFADWRPPRDARASDYDVHRGKGTAIVIDNGSSTCRVGWADESSPRLVFDNIVCEPKNKKKGHEHYYVGNDITSEVLRRYVARSPLERGIVTSLETQVKLLLDPICTHGESIPVLATYPASFFRPIIFFLVSLHLALPPPPSSRWA